MSHLAHPKAAIRLGSLRHRSSSARAARVAAPGRGSESIAAPLMLGAVVVGALLLAVASALVTALGA